MALVDWAAVGGVVTSASGWGAGSAVTKEVAENKAAQRKILVCVISEIFWARNPRMHRT